MKAAEAAEARDLSEERATATAAPSRISSDAIHHGDEHHRQTIRDIDAELRNDAKEREESKLHTEMSGMGGGGGPARPTAEQYEVTDAKATAGANALQAWKERQRMKAAEAAEARDLSEERARASAALSRISNDASHHGDQHHRQTIR